MADAIEINKKNGAKKISYDCTERMGEYDQKRTYAYKGVGWPKSGDFERTYFLNGHFIDFIIQNMAYLIDKASYAADNRPKQTRQFKRTTFHNR